MWVQHCSHFDSLEFSYLYHGDNYVNLAINVILSEKELDICSRTTVISYIYMGGVPTLSFHVGAVYPFHHSQWGRCTHFIISCGGGVPTLSFPVGAVYSLYHYHRWRCAIFLPYNLKRFNMI